MKDPEYKKMISETIKNHASDHLQTPISDDEKSNITNFDLYKRKFTVNPSALWESILSIAQENTKSFLKIRNCKNSQTKTDLEDAIKNANNAHENNKV